MKSLKMRNALILVLSFVFALSMLIFAGSVKPVNAEDAATGVQLIDGATIRIGDKNKENDSGLRFTAMITDQTYQNITTNDTNDTVTMGFIITPKQLFDTRAGDDYINDISNYVGDQGVGIKVVEKKDDGSTTFYQKSGYDGYWFANAAVINVKNPDLQYVAIAYINNNGSYTYALAENGGARSIIQTASNAYVQGAADLDYFQESEDLSGFGSTIPVQINEGQDLYNLSTASATNDFAECTFLPTKKLTVQILNVRILCLL